MFTKIYQNLLSSGQFAKINQTYSRPDLLSILNKASLSYSDFLALISTSARTVLTEMAVKSRTITRQHFGKTMQIYAPLYLSNECSNECLYCGFNHKASIRRKTLNTEELNKELVFLRKTGFEQILLLTGEHQKKAGTTYISQSIKQAKKVFTSVSLEILPLSTPEYSTLVDSGATGVTLYQETYDQKRYSEVHPKGPKRDFFSRLEAPERALNAGIRTMGIGALLGLYPWQPEIAFVAAHAALLKQQYWKSHITISLPRLIHSPLPFTYPVSDKALVQMIVALRLFLPTVGLVLSTREPASLRDNLIDIGITQISAQSSTKPGGYTENEADDQFEIEDHRSLKEIKVVLKNKGFDPILRDWSPIFGGTK